MHANVANGVHHLVEQNRDHDVDENDGGDDHVGDEEEHGHGLHDAVFPEKITRDGSCAQASGVTVLIQLVALSICG